MIIMLIKPRDPGDPEFLIKPIMLVKHIMHISIKSFVLITPIIILYVTRLISIRLLYCSNFLTCQNN